MIAVCTLSFGPPLPQEHGKVCPPCFPQPRPLSTCKQDTQTRTTQDHYVGTNPPPAHAHPCSNRGTYQRVCPPPPFLYPRPHLCAYRTCKTRDDIVTSPLSYPPCSRAIRGCMMKSTMLDTRHVGTGAFCYARTGRSSRREVSLSGVGSGFSALATCDASMW